MKVLAALFVGIVLSLAFVSQLSFAQVSPGISESAKFTVYPDGSVSLGANLTESIPTGGVNVGSVSGVTAASTSGGVTTVKSNVTETLPPSEVDQAPFNYSGSISATGSYANGVAKGQINLQAVQGVSSPLSSFVLTYQGSGSQVTASGNLTLVYGTYSDAGTMVTVNQTTIATALTMVQQEGLNSTYLDHYFATIPGANATVNDLTLKAAYGSGFAVITGNFQLTGDFAALAEGLVTDYLCASTTVTQTAATTEVISYDNTTTTITMSMPSSSTSSSSGTCSLSEASMNPSESLALSALFSSYKSYTYTLAYSDGTLGVQETAQATQNFNLDTVRQLLVAGGSGTGLNGSQLQFLNSTRIDLSNYRATVNEYPVQNQTEVEQTSYSNIWLYPPIVRSGSAFNESSLFTFLSPSLSPTWSQVTLVGGSNSGSYVSLDIPSGVPTPVSTTGNSATWNSVKLNQLAPVLFDIVGTSPTSTSSTTQTSQSSSASSQSSSSAPASSTTSSQSTIANPGGQASNSTNTLLYAGAAVAVVLVGGTAFYLLWRRPSVAPATSPPSQ